MVNQNMKIAVAGTGYVGLSLATLLSQHHQVTAVDGGWWLRKLNLSTTESRQFKTNI